MEEKNYIKWTKKEFESLPSPPSFQNEIGEVDCLVIIPTRHTHDSGLGKDSNSFFVHLM